MSRFALLLGWLLLSELACAGHLLHYFRNFNLNDSGKLRWRGLEDGRDVIYTKEPQSTWGQRFIAGIVRLLPVKGQL